MADIIQFVSRAQLSAQENLNEFIRLAQHDLTAFSGGGAWADLTWRDERVSMVFCKYRPRTESNHAPIPLAEPFLQFAKAYFRYQYSHKPVTSAARMLAALRMVELALIEATGRADIQELNVPVLDLSIRYCVKLQESKVSQYQVGRQIEALSDFCRAHELVPGLPNWKSPLRKQPILTESLTQEGSKHRESKLPSNHAMLALADLFAQAEDVESRYFTSIMVLMMFAPSRISEVFALPLGCIDWAEDSKGIKRMYLRWRAAKGGGEMKKWVTESMQEVVEEAVARLRIIGAPAREAAKFAYDNPGCFMRHAGCLTPQDFGENDELSPEQVAAAVGVKYARGHGWSGLPSSWAKLGNGGPVTYRVLADKTAELYQGSHWPYINKHKKVLYWDALCLVREFDLHKDFSARLFSWRIEAANEVNTRLGGRENSSLFERTGLKNLDGSSIKLTTHQLRHWLSTMAVRAGMDDFTLARWAGRARIEDNQHYDHRTQEERSDELRMLLRPNEPTTLEKFKGRLPVTYNELGVDRLGVAKATLYGMCVHDYAMTPCQKQSECMTCKEHVCIKGDHITLDRIKGLEEMTSTQLDKARQASSGGIFGADRWTDHYKWKLAHVRTMRTMLEAGSVPDGSVLRIPDEYDPSPVRRTLMELNLVEPPASIDVPTPKVISAIKGPEGA